MQVQASYIKYKLRFIREAVTSRDVFTSKNAWFLFLSDGEKTGIGECSLLHGLSIDDSPDFKKNLNEVCQTINRGEYNFKLPLEKYPSIQFGLETALTDLQNGGERILFPSLFTLGEKGIVTNGLIWMGNKTYMRKQIAEKLEKGFTCIKLKIGSLEWKTEKEIIAEMRRQFNVKELTIKVDANGAFSLRQATEVLSVLAEMQVHSIEQPIKAGHWNEMARLCESSPTPIALDEELIGVFPFEKKRRLLETIHPQYLILKPGLLGGFQASDEWIQLAEEYNTGWWATSALESNIGLNAIAQWVSTKNTTLHQGLGTGMLFSNNIDSPLTLQGEQLFYDANKVWGKIERE
ncbi:MAG: o-succinylbenzoate synthase [Prolixibacteraceae bacterium]|nr:o-succinylbenzoate synthase [Prolixibacteraceae bacterium]